METRDPLGETWVCPVCRQSLQWAEQGATCSGCEAVYAVQSGVPILVAPTSDPDALNQGQKAQQTDYFDHEADDEFETTRPHLQPRFYGWLMRYKFRASIGGLPRLQGLSALTVCGGSGMDGEALAREGARVVVSDISPRAAARAIKRSQRFHIPLHAVVADAERLPLPDRSVDVVYCHDGLHHLVDPYAGLSEMLRVARRAISITEPSRATATRIAVHLGVSTNVEDAGNLVMRLDRREVTEFIERAGFRVVESRRYAMYYAHSPGRITAVLSRPPVFAAATRAFALLQRFTGPFGNKLTVQAIRRGVEA